MTDTADAHILDAIAQIDFAVANSSDCPCCESTSDTHVVKHGQDALRGSGIYCGMCETFIAGLPDITS